METKGRIYGAKVKTDRDTCYYCKCSVDDYSRTVDHLIPESKGGIRANKNKVYSCRDCNRLKDDMTPEEFQQHLRRLIRTVVHQHKKQVSHYKKVAKNVDLLIASKKH